MLKKENVYALHYIGIWHGRDANQREREQISKFWRAKLLKNYSYRLLSHFNKLLTLVKTDAHTHMQTPYTVIFIGMKNKAEITYFNGAT